MLTLGLDGEEIAFSIPTVTAFNESAVVDAPKVRFPCGKPFKGYTTASYSNTGLENLCWTTQNIAEGVAAATSYDSGGSNPQSGRGWYYDWSQADAACKELGAEWSVPSLPQWSAFLMAFSTLAPGAGTIGTATSLRDDWTGGSAMNGSRNQYGIWAEWDVALWLWAQSTEGLRWDAATGNISSHSWPMDPTNKMGVRCVRSL
ncbi:hypothetical protein AGMMS49525_02760 [Bacteroidia bacterium]|nr:hypothetical protein AGMMS49525_02760 [Bacteroidia bacterium]